MENQNNNQMSNHDAAREFQRFMREGFTFQECRDFFGANNDFEEMCQTFRSEDNETEFRTMAQR